MPVLQKAVNACGNDPSKLVCAYAMFNLAQALRLTGHADQAIPLLERRLQNPDQRATVQRELALAKGQRRRRRAGRAQPAPNKPGQGPKGKGPKGD